MKEPVYLDLSKEQLTPVKVKQEFYMVDNEAHKARLLTQFLATKSIFKGIIFSATKINADRLADTLKKQGLQAAALHGDLKQNARNRVVEQMRRGKIQYLVATDVAARGISIPDVTHVINYDLPKFAEDYVHRIGRTGRANKTGTAFSFLMPYDGMHLKRLERYLNTRFELSVEPGFEATRKLNMDPAPKKKNFRKGKPNFSKPGFAKKSDKKPSFKKATWTKKPKRTVKSA